MWPTSCLLFQFQPRVDIVPKEIFLLLMRGVMPHFMYLYHSVTFFQCLFNLWGAPSSTENPFLRGVAATVAPQQHGIGLFLLDTGRTKGKGQLVTTSHWKYRVKQIGGGENIHEGNAKIVGNVLISRLGQNGGISDGVTGILVDPRVKGGHVYIAYFFSFRGHRVKRHGPGLPPKKAFRGCRGSTKEKSVTNCLTAGSCSHRMSQSHSHITSRV